MEQYYRMVWKERRGDEDMWKDIKHPDIVSIDKVVGEYNMWVLEKSPYGKFKIKIYEKAIGEFVGYSSLKVINPEGRFDGAVGIGKTEEEALNDTLMKYFELVSWKNRCEESDFQYVNLLEF